MKLIIAYQCRNTTYSGCAFDADTLCVLWTHRDTSKGRFFTNMFDKLLRNTQQLTERPRGSHFVHIEHMIDDASTMPNVTIDANFAKFQPIRIDDECRRIVASAMHIVHTTPPLIKT